MKLFLSLIALLALLAGCRVEPNFDDLSSDFIVSTSADKNASFGDFKTYYISDSIVYIGESDDDGLVSTPETRQLIQAVKQNMAARGYVFTSRAAKPDLGLSLTAIKDIDVVEEYYPGWWDWYWPGCYWWYCYPYYYPWTTYYTYTTGTVILNMYDLKNAESKGAITGLWNVTGLGALGSTTSINTSLGVDALNQGFEQSPYIKSN